MRDRLLLGLYAAALLLFTSVHEPRWLALALLLALLAAGDQRWRLARNAALAVLAFNAVVSLSYAALALWHGHSPAAYLVLMNLRVYLLTYLTLWLSARVNLFRALDFSRTLVFLLTLAYSQALSLRRVYQEFRLALRSRTIGRLAARDVYRHRASLGGFLLDKSLHEATDIAQALRSRGFFDG